MFPPPTSYLLPYGALVPIVAEPLAQSEPAYRIRSFGAGLRIRDKIKVSGPPMDPLNYGGPRKSNTSMPATHRVQIKTLSYKGSGEVVL